MKNNSVGLSELLNYIVIGGILYVVYLMYNNGLLGGLKGLLTGRNTEGNVISGNQAKSVDVVANAISPQDAARYAEQLYVAFDRVGTDNSAVEMVYMSLVNRPIALRDVYSAFGSRSYLGWGHGSAWGIIDMGVKKDLIGWIREELGGKDLDKWLALFRSAGLL